MAPAGSMEAFMAAIQGGADSIYFGVDQLNMRARAANNFLLSDLPELAKIAKEHRVKTYVTLNTILYDHDISVMKRIIDSIKENDITAIIAADHAAIQYAFSKGVEVHLSTQVNVTNLETVKFYSMFSDVVVLSRELSLKQIKDIVDGIKKEDIRGPKGELVRIEIFAHGALCMAVSGKCYLSLHTANSSANRGACQQNCRKTYKVIDMEDGHELEIDNEYIMSPKDLCTMNFLDEVIASGVTVLKLEGRGRAPEYVKQVTSCYKEAVLAIQNDTFTDENIKTWMDRLETVYNRGFWSGYYLGQKMGEWTNKHGSSATTRKVYLGKGKRYFPKINVGEFILESHKLKVGDDILIIGPTTGVIETKVEEIRIDDQIVQEVTKGIPFSIPVSEAIRSSDKLYKVVAAND